VVSFLFPPHRRCAYFYFLNDIYYFATIAKGADSEQVFIPKIKPFQVSTQTWDRKLAQACYRLGLEIRVSLMATMPHLATL
jgi:hypothetical protein